MARNDRNTPSNKGRVKLRVIEFELDGSDATLQESIKGILSAINTRSSGTIRTSPALTAKNNADPDAEETTEVDVNEETLSDSGTQEDENIPREKKQRYYKTPQIVNDLDTNSGAMPLKVFCEDSGAV